MNIDESNDDVVNMSPSSLVKDWAFERWHFHIQSPGTDEPFTCEIFRTGLFGAGNNRINLLFEMRRRSQIQNKHVADHRFVMF